MRRIILCCDGTWNHPDQKGRGDGPNKPSNIVKIARSILPVDSMGTTQVVYYQRGVGTGNIVDKFVGGIAGDGLDKNIIDCYRFLVNNYQEGDQVFIFGFSRGAYTARSLTGLLNYVGLLPKNQSYFTPLAYEHYRNRDLDIEKFKAINRSRNIVVKFIGVFDTVGSRGIPLKLFQRRNKRKHGFHDTSLSQIVESAYHALAVDEQRKPFKPTLWDETLLSHQTMEQRWFSGVHTNVGGGYPDDGLANCALHWILDAATQLGLIIDREFINKYAPHAPDTLYDSMTFVYRILGRHMRKIRLSELQTLDGSVKERLDTVKEYSPQNIPPDPTFQKTLST